MAAPVKLVAPRPMYGYMAAVIWLGERLSRNREWPHLDHLSLWEIDVPCFTDAPTDDSLDAQDSAQDSNDAENPPDGRGPDLWHTAHFITSFQYTTPSGDVIDDTSGIIETARQHGLHAFGLFTTYADLEAFVTVISDADIPPQRIAKHIQDLGSSHFPRGPWALPIYRHEPIRVD